MGSQLLPNRFSRDTLELTYKFCRFDNIDTRKERQVHDKFCHVRELWDKFIKQSESLYDLGPNTTIDEKCF